MTVYVCGEEAEDIFTAIYDAWYSKLGHSNVRIEPVGCDSELFSTYVQVEADEEKSRKVADSIRCKLSESIYELVYKATLSQDKYRADKIYRYLILAFAYGTRIVDKLQIPQVFELFSMNRNLGREYDHMLGFTRFAQTRDGILLSKIGPKNDITVLLARHFADRMPEENWIIYDTNRKKAAVHQKQSGWLMVRADSPLWHERLSHDTDEESFEQLWKTFHNSIAIKERTNPRCQMNMLPLRFRPYMTEFQEKH